MGVIIIPSNYKEEGHSSIVPICIADPDSEGNPIYRGWVEHGVIPVADVLRKIAGKVLDDVWRVSEITELAVHSLSRNRRNDLGDEPSLRVLRRARSYAKDLRVGGRRARRKTEVELFSAKLETLQDQFDFVSDLAAKDTLDRLVDELGRQKLNDVREMLPFILDGWETKALVSRFREPRNTLSQRFYRGMRKAASATGITW